MDVGGPHRQHPDVAAVEVGDVRDRDAVVLAVDGRDERALHERRSDERCDCRGDAHDRQQPAPRVRPDGLEQPKHREHDEAGEE